MATWRLPRLSERTVPSGLEGQIYYDENDNNVYVYTADGTTVMALGAGDIDVDNLPEGDNPNQVLVTGAGNAPTYQTITAGTLLGRSATGDVQAQKLQPSMIVDNSIPHTKLSNIRQGQVLGALPPEGGVAGSSTVGAIEIADIVGATITSGDTAPANPSANDLWFYEGNHEDPTVQSGDQARLYIYNGNTWIDVSPPVFNTNPGPAGPPGQDGSTGRSVSNVLVQEREGDEDIILEFIDEDRMTIAAVTIPIADLQTSVIPNPPAGGAQDEDYVLRVPQTGTGTPSWETASAVPMEVNLGKGVATFSVPMGSTSSALLIRANEWTEKIGDPLTSIPTMHYLTFNGLILQQGLDYTVDAAGLGVTLSSAARSAIESISGPDTAREIQLSYFTVSLSTS